MQNVVQDALGSLKALGTVEELKARAAGGLAPAGRPKVNAHIHLPPNFSAFESVEQAVGLAAEQGIGVLGVSNYYDYTVYGDFVVEARKRGIFPLFGLEIIALDSELAAQGVKLNDPGNPGKLYICGKGITRFGEMTPRAAELLNIIREKDSTRMREMIDRMAAIFDDKGLETGLDETAVIDMVVRRHGSPRETVYLQERHLCQAFQESLFARVALDERLSCLSKVLGKDLDVDPDDHVQIQNAIRSNLMKAGKPAYLEETFVNFQQARELILELGGIPCYPTLADGASPISPYERDPSTLIENIRANDIHCAEFIPVRNHPDVLERYVMAMREAGLAVTAGTEHNSLSLIPIEPACEGAAPVPEAVKSIFWEGACVVAAHQFLTLHGQTGYVDAQGRPNPDYADSDARIQAFAALGAAVIEKYREEVEG